MMYVRKVITVLREALLLCSALLVQTRRQLVLKLRLIVLPVREASIVHLMVPSWPLASALLVITVLRVPQSHL